MAKFKSLYPAPVIVAFFASGEHVRMSFWQPSPKADKPIAWRFGPAIAMVKSVIGNERARANGWSGKESPFGKPAEDILTAFVEWNGAVYREEPALARGDARKARLEASRVAREAIRAKRAAIGAKRAATLADRELRKRISRQISIHIAGGPRPHAHATTTKAKRNATTKRKCAA
jgi:hypothetical protein